jgi:hypothetical protein
MMKAVKSFILVFGLYSISYSIASADCDSPFLKKVMSYHPEIAYQEENVIAACKKFPDKPEFTAFAILNSSGGDTNSYDLNTYIVESNSGKIVSNLYEKQQGEWLRNLSVDIDTAPYRLNESIRAFGIRVKTYYRFDEGSSGSYSSSDNLSLYIFDKKNISNILSQIELSKEQGGLSPEDCNNSNHSRTIIVSSQKTDGYNDFLIIEKVKNIKKGVGHKCIDSPITTNKYTIKYDSSSRSYLIPKQISSKY